MPKYGTRYQKHVLKYVITFFKMCRCVICFSRKPNTFQHLRKHLKDQKTAAEIMRGMASVKGLVPEARIRKIPDEILLTY